MPVSIEVAECLVVVVSHIPSMQGSAGAGFLRDDSFTDVTMKDGGATIDVRLWSAFVCTKATWSGMRETYELTSFSSALYGNFSRLAPAVQPIG